MFLTVLFPHSRKILIKTIFTSYFSSFWPMINFLIFSQSLINLRLYSWTSPHNRPFLFSITSISKSIIFKSIPYQLKICPFIKLEIKSLICGFVRSNTHRINIWSEKHIFFMKFAKRGRRLILSLFIGFINFTLKYYLIFLMLFLFLINLSWSISAHISSNFILYLFIFIILNIFFLNYTFMFDCFLIWMTLIFTIQILRFVHKNLKWIYLHIL